MKQSPGKETAVRTTCPYCGVGCGVTVSRIGAIPVAVQGDEAHPANFGRLCSKGAALLDTLDNRHRLLGPRINAQDVSWAHAIDHIAESIATAIDQHGPDSVAFYVSGQLLTEDYYVVNKFVKGYLGTANIDTNSRLCMASSVAGHKRAFGSDTVPVDYEDLEKTDLVILAGSNLAWCHPILYQRLIAAKEKNHSLQIILIDPRETPTAEIADYHLQVESGTDRHLFGGLLHYLKHNNNLDQHFLNEHTEGLEDALAACSHLSIDAVACKTGCTADEIRRLYATFAQSEKTVTVYSQGVNQSLSGTDTVNSIINCHLASGKIGKKGCGPFSITGQPNAMGGREVGGLANMLAAHMEIENPAHRQTVQRFWDSPRIATTTGLKAVELFKSAANGKIKVLWVMGTNPADSLPEANLVNNALAKIPQLIVSDLVSNTDTVRHATVQLPALAWGEKDGTVTNSERRISRQRAVRPAPGDARADWWAISEVAKKLGYTPAFDYTCSADIFREHAALSGTDNQGTRDFDISAFAQLSNAGYESLEPFQWPRPCACNTSQIPTLRFFADGKFYTKNQRARLWPLAGQDPEPLSGDYPLRLNTGRIRDQWHTMTRTGYSTRLSSHFPEPFLDLNPSDAEACNISPSDLVDVSSEHGQVQLRARFSESQPAGSAFAPMHWTDQFSSNARIDSVIGARTDPHSGQPASKSQPIRISRRSAACYGFAVTRQNIKPAADIYWASAVCPSGWRTEFASSDVPDRLFSLWREACSTLRNDHTIEISYEDASNRQFRFAAFNDNQLLSLVFLAAEPVRVARQSMVAALELEFCDARQRSQLLTSCAPADVPDPGTTICSCNNIGCNQIVNAIADGCDSVEALGRALSAGTNCGSCRSELAAMLPQKDSTHGRIADSLDQAEGCCLIIDR